MENEAIPFPYTLTVDVPFPTHRLAQTAFRALSVDQELSPLVKRKFEIASPDTGVDAGRTSLRTTYSATTNRMLRVAVNGFFESLNVVVQVMQELDTDVIANKGLEGLERVQGVEQGLTGETKTGA